MSRGALYVAYGGPAIACAKEAVASLKAHEPDMDYRIITDAKIADLKCTLTKATDKGARDVKTRLPDFVPAEWTQAMYIDADTVILRPLSRFFQPLNRGWDIVMVRDRLSDTVVHCRLKNRAELQYTAQAYEGGDLTQYSGGIMAWNVGKQVTRLFRIWHAEWKRFGYRDQGALVRAIAQVPIALWPLGWRANAPDPDVAIEIWHQHGKARQPGAQ